MFPAGSNIYVDRGIWKGWHKVVNPLVYNAEGIVETTTPFNCMPNKTDSGNSAFGFDISASNDTWTPDSSADWTDVAAWMNAFPESGDKYLFFSGAVHDNNDGLFKVSFNKSTLVITALAKIITTQRSTEAITLQGEGEWADVTPDLVDADDDNVQLYRAFPYKCLIYSSYNSDSGQNIMEDETWDIDITHTQAEAVIYYIKAKIAEDMMDMKTREYFMRLFKKQVEKFSSGRKTGPSIIQSHWSMR